MRQVAAVLDADPGRVGAALDEAVAAGVNGPLRTAGGWYHSGMDAILPWLTPAVVIAVGAWLRADLGGRMDRMDKRLDALDNRLTGRIDGLDNRLDNAVHQLRADIAAVNTRIVLLADRGKQDRGAA